MPTATPTDPRRAESVPMSDALLSSRLLYRGWLTLRMLRLRLAGQEVERTLVEHPSGAQVLAYDPDRRVAMVVRQTRYAPLFLGLPPLWEPIGGADDEGDDAETTAAREALEEAGLRLRALEPVGHVWMTPSTTTERVRLFLAAYAPRDRIAAGGGIAHEGEEIEAEEWPLDALWTQVASGEIADAKLFMLVHALRVRRPELFGS